MMSIQIFVAAFVALAPMAAAQLAGLPACAVTPSIGIISGSQCQLTDFACICESPEIISSLSSVVGASCTDPADISSGYAAAESLCASYGGVATSATTTATGAGATAISDASTTFTSATVTSAPYAAGNATATLNTSGTGATGVSANRTSAGSSPIATGAATKNGVASVREAGLLAGILAVAGAVIML